MAKVHDMGGRPNDDPIDQGEHVLMDWERRIDSIRGVLGEKGLSRRGRTAPRHRGLDAGTATSRSATTNAGPRRWRPCSSRRACITAAELDAVMARQEN